MSESKNEIEKLYKLAGVEKQVTCSHSDTCYNGSLSECEGCNSYKYPSFTAEKQLNLIKWLSDTDYYIHNIYKTIDTKEYCIENDFYDMQTNKFEETLAKLINYLWQDLTETEQEEIGNILKEGQDNG